MKRLTIMLVSLIAQTALLLSPAVAAVPDGVVVYCTGTGLKNASSMKYVVFSGGSQSSPKTLTSQSGKNPRISPDGKYVAFDNGSNKLYICELKENTSPQSLGSGSHPYWVKKSDGWYLFYSDRSCKCSFGTGKSFLRKIDRGSAKFTSSATEIKYNGQSSIMKGGMGVNGTYACTGYPDCTIGKADPNGAVKKIGGSQKCNPSIAPTTNKMMILDDTGHRTIATYTIGGSRWSWKPGGYVQNPEWSTDENWCTFVSGDHSGGQVWVGDMKNKNPYKINGASGTFPHYYKGSTKPGAAQPSLSASPSKLEFSAEQGGSAPSAKTVTVSISSGSVSGLQASESAGWLTTSVSGDKVANEVSLSGLSAKTYTTTVNLSATGADPTSYSVSFTVVEPQVLTSIAISPSNPTVVLSSTLQLTAKAKDQNGKDMVDQPSFTWEATGAGSISSSGLFTAGSSEGTATVTAKGGGKSATTTVTVSEQPPVALKINCGGTATGEWKADQYSSGGAAYDFGASVDVSKATNPAPASVYETVRHKDPTYTIPSSVVPNGTYTVRLHFNDGRGSVGDRKIDVSIEGKPVLSSYDIVAEAGGQNIAVIEEATVSVSDGNGLTIAFSQGAGDDAFVAGIEVSNGGTPSEPTDTVKVLSPKEGESYKVGDVMHIKWQTAESIVNDVQLEITVDGGKSYHPVYADGSIDVNMDAWGDYAWTIPPTITDDGQTITLAGKTCAIRVIEYSGMPNDVSGSFTITEASVASSKGPATFSAQRPVSVDSRVGEPLQIAVSRAGAHRLWLVGANGATVAQRSGGGSVTYRFEELIAAQGLYLVRVEGTWGRYSRVIVLGR